MSTTPAALSGDRPKPRGSKPRRPQISPGPTGEAKIRRKAMERIARKTVADDQDPELIGESEFLHRLPASWPPLAAL